MQFAQEHGLGLREMKRAKLKLALLQAAIRQMGQRRRGLGDLPVEAICAEVEVSRVTFFNYFPFKADLLNYFWRVWCFELAVAEMREPLCGLRALRRIFDRIFLRSAEAHEAPTVFLNLIGWIASLATPPPPVELTRAERHLLFPGDERVFELEIPHFRELLARHVSEARREGEIGCGLPERELSILFLTVLYGAPLALHVSGEKDLLERYRTHFELMVRALQ